MNLLLVAVLVLPAAGQAGGLHPAGDSLAVLQVPLMIAGLVLVGLARGRWLWRGLVPLGLLGLLAVRVVDWTVPGASPPDAPVVYQKNLRYRGLDHATFLAEIAETMPDVITLQEVSEANRGLMDALRASHPAQHLCPFAAVGGTAVLSRHPAGDARCTIGLAAFQVDTPAGPAWIVSIHLRWLWPYRQAEHSETLLSEVAALPGVVVIGGDFIMVPWSHRLRAFARAARGRLAGPVRATLWKANLPLPIDHVLAPCGGQRIVRPEFGSDHMGVLARVALACD